ncbi:Exocyst complex component 5, partial [Elasticomyces elasticus]
MPAATPDSASILSHGSSVAARSAFNRGNVFTLDTFSSKDFIVKDFVEALSDSAVPASRRSGSTARQAFDPKPLIRTFEHALSRLKTLSEDLETRENELSGSVRRAEAQHNQNIRSRERELEQAVHSFQRLERSLDGDADSGGNAAVRIGERLEELDRQRQRAQDVKFILQCWLEVSEKGDLSSLEDVRRLGGGDGKVRCAHIARQLLKISQRLDPASQAQMNGTKHANGVNGVDHGDESNGTPPKYKTREIIEKFLEMLEKDLLKQFDDFYRRQNFDGMRECAIALRDFNDGASVMGLFVNQHQFFIDRSQLITEELPGDTEVWNQSADPDAEPPAVEPTLRSLIDEVKVVMQEESFIIKRAFPFYEEVLARFLQRVFQQSIQQRLEMVLDKANSISSLTFLRSLQAAKIYIAALVDDLKAHGLTEHPDPVSSPTAAVLDQQLDDLFVPYFVGSSYIEREKKNLEELCTSLLFKFTIYHSRRRKIPTSYLGSLSARSKELISSARDVYIDRLDSADLPASQKAMLTRIAGLNSSSASADTKADANIDVNDEDGQLSLPFTKRMLKWLAESVGRGLELAPTHETPKDVRELLHLLIANMGEIYLETSLDAANETAAGLENTKSEPDLSYITDLRTSIAILHLMVTTIQTLLLPLAASHLTIRRELEKATNAFVERTEGKIDSVLQRTIDAALAYTTRLLGGQRKADFRPRDDAQLQLDALQTPTCASVVAFLSRLRDRAAASLAGRVRALFLAELATGLRALLLAHFRSYQVSLTGGLVVSKDMTQYIALLRSFDLPEEVGFDASLEVLTEIANLFVINAEALRERVRGIGSGTLGGVEKADLRPYLLRRED